MNVSLTQFAGNSASIGQGSGPNPVPRNNGKTTIGNTCRPGRNVGRPAWIVRVVPNPVYRNANRASVESVRLKPAGSFRHVRESAGEQPDPRVGPGGAFVRLDGSTGHLACAPHL